MKSKLLLAIMIVGMISVTGCSNDAGVVIGDDIHNSNSIENNEVISENDNSESISDVLKNNVNEDTIIVPSTNKENVIKKEDNNVEENVVNIKIENIPVGAYISYVPARGTVTVLSTDTGTDQTFTPTEYKDGWRVLYNNNGQLDIISAESVGKLTLGKKASSSNDEYDSVLNGGKIGYGKSIYVLNKICNSYASGEHAISGRCLGIGNGVNNLFDEGISMDDYVFFVWKSN